MSGRYEMTDAQGNPIIKMDSAGGPTTYQYAQGHPKFGQSWDQADTPVAPTPQLPPGGMWMQASPMQMQQQRQMDMQQQRQMQQMLPNTMQQQQYNPFGPGVPTVAEQRRQIGTMPMQQPRGLATSASPNDLMTRTIEYDTPNRGQLQLRPQVGGPNFGGGRGRLQPTGHPIGAQPIGAPPPSTGGYTSNTPQPKRGPGDVSGHFADIKNRYGLTDEETNAAVESKGQSLAGRSPVQGATSYYGKPLETWDMPQQPTGQPIGGPGYATPTSAPPPPQPLGQPPSPVVGAQQIPPGPMSGPGDRTDVANIEVASPYDRQMIELESDRGPGPERITDIGATERDEEYAMENMGGPDQGTGGGLAEQEWRLKIEPVEMNMGGRIPSYQNGGDINPDRLLQALGDTLSTARRTRTIRGEPYTTPADSVKSIMNKSRSFSIARNQAAANRRAQVVRELGLGDVMADDERTRIIQEAAVRGADLGDLGWGETLENPETGEVIVENLYSTDLARKMLGMPAPSEADSVLLPSPSRADSLAGMPSDILEYVQSLPDNGYISRIEAMVDPEHIAREKYGDSIINEAIRLLPPGRASGGIIGLAHGGMVPDYAHGGEVPGYFLGGLMKGIKSLGKGLGKAAGVAAPFAGLIPGVGTLASTGLGALGTALSDVTSGKGFNLGRLAQGAGRGLMFGKLADKLGGIEGLKDKGILGGLKAAFTDKDIGGQVLDAVSDIDPGTLLTLGVTEAAGQRGAAEQAAQGEGGFGNVGMVNPMSTQGRVMPGQVTQPRTQGVAGQLTYGDQPMITYGASGGLIPGYQYGGMMGDEEGGDEFGVAPYLPRTMPQGRGTGSRRSRVRRPRIAPRENVEPVRRPPPANVSSITGRVEGLPTPPPIVTPPPPPPPPVAGPPPPPPMVDELAPAIPATAASMPPPPPPPPPPPTSGAGGMGGEFEGDTVGDEFTPTKPVLGGSGVPGGARLNPQEIQDELPRTVAAMPPPPPPPVAPTPGAGGMGGEFEGDVVGDEFTPTQPVYSGGPTQATAEPDERADEYEAPTQPVVDQVRDVVPQTAAFMPEPGEEGEGEGELDPFATADPGEYGQAPERSIETTYDMNPYGDIPHEVREGKREMTQEEIDKRAGKMEKEVERQVEQAQTEAKKELAATNQLDLDDKGEQANEMGEPDQQDLYTIDDKKAADMKKDAAVAPSGKLDLNTGEVTRDEEYIAAQGPYMGHGYGEGLSGSAGATRVMPGSQATGQAMATGPVSQSTGAGSGFYGEQKWFDPNAEAPVDKQMSGLDPHQLPRTAQDFAAAGDAGGAGLLSRLGMAEGGLVENMTPEDMQDLAQASMQLDSPGARETVQRVMSKYQLSAADLSQLLAVLSQQMAGSESLPMQQGGLIDGGGGDAMADDIYVDATINANGDKQTIAVSAGEYIVPGDVVGHLGSGNTERGADVMDTFVTDVRMDRTGTAIQPDPINLSEVLPLSYGERYE